MHNHTADVFTHWASRSVTPAITISPTTLAEPETLSQQLRLAIADSGKTQLGWPARVACTKLLSADSCSKSGR